MHPKLTYQLSIARIEDLHREAARHRIAAHTANADRSSRVRRLRLPSLGTAVRPMRRIA